jgi:hypothetical protein
MKKKSPSKATPSISVPAKIEEEIPPELIAFEKIKACAPREFVERMFAPKLKSATDEEAKPVIEAFAGLLSGIPDFFDFRVQVPDWTKKASAKFLKATGINFAAANKGNLTEFGKIFGLLEPEIPKETPSELQKAATSLKTFVRTEAAKAPAKDAKEFFTGVERGEKIPDKLLQLAQRTKVFAIIAGSWRHVETLESAGQLHNWLKEEGIIVARTDAAETRKVCRMIGLKLRDEAGRPLKKKE